MATDPFTLLINDFRFGGGAPADPIFGTVNTGLDFLKWLTGGVGEEQAATIGEAAGLQSGAATEGAGMLGEATARAQAGVDPYNQAGQRALQMQQALAGALGPEAQAQAYQMLQDSPAFAAAMQQGQKTLLQNASATGGLRGGNAQRGLASLGPQILAALAQQQSAQLASLSGQGLSAAGQSGQFGLAGTGAQAGLLQDAATYQAGGLLGQTQARLAGRQQLVDQGLQLAGTGAELGARVAGAFF